MEGCLYKTKLRGNFQRHAGVHLHITYDCMECDAKYASKYDLNQHMKFKHLGGEKLSCEFCGKEYNSRSGMSAHRRNVHLDQPVSKPQSLKTVAGNDLVYDQSLQKNTNCSYESKL